ALAALAVDARCNRPPEPSLLRGDRKLRPALGRPETLAHRLKLLLLIAELRPRPRATRPARRPRIRRPAEDPRHGDVQRCTGPCEEKQQETGGPDRPPGWTRQGGHGWQCTT